jgi:hypothetical protein
MADFCNGVNQAEWAGLLYIFSDVPRAPRFSCVELKVRRVMSRPVA